MVLKPTSDHFLNFTIIDTLFSSGQKTIDYQIF